MDADHGEEYQYSEEDEEEYCSKCDTDDSRPLLILFDCKTTGLSIYADHITDIGAMQLRLAMETEEERRTRLENDAAILCLSFKLDVLTT